MKVLRDPHHSNPSSREIEIFDIIRGGVSQDHWASLERER